MIGTSLYAKSASGIIAVHVTSAADVDAFKKELSAEGSEISENFFNKWVDFETYRRIVFKDEHWTE